MAGWFSFLSKFVSNNDNPGGYKLAESYSGLRKLMLSTKPEQVGAALAGPDDVFGLLMDSGLPNAIFSLVALADGSASLYFSNGGGIIGLGSQAGPKRAAEAFVTAAGQFAGQMAPTKRFPLPTVGLTRFYLLTKSGIRTASASTDDLAESRHSLSPFFHKGNELITEIRKFDEKRQRQQH